MTAESPLKQHTPRLLLELLVVILGITISFWFQEWRQGQDDRAEEQRLLTNIKLELSIDRDNVNKRAQRLTDGIARMQQLTSAPSADHGLSQQAIDLAMDDALGYMSFSPATATYTELSQTGASRLIRDKQLVRQIISLYESQYPTAVEWDVINRKFVLDRMFPYLDMHGPAIDATITGAMATGYHAAFEVLSPNTQFRNLLRTGALFKEGQRLTYTRLVKQIDSVLAALP